MIAASHLFVALEGVAHALVVGILSLLVLQGARIPFAAALIVLPVSAWHLEALQHLLPGRQLSLSDAAINVIAALAVAGWWAQRTVPAAEPAEQAGRGQ